MAFDYYGGWAPYVSVAERRRQAAREVAKLAKKAGRPPAPVVIDGRKIATTFWGMSWCENLERYSDYATRLPRGRSYVRNGCVVDLWITPGRITARVSGSELYTTTITVAPMARNAWRTVCRDVAGAIDSVIELLQGRLSTSVMARLDADPALLFTLRQVKQEDLIVRAGTGTSLTRGRSTSRRVLDEAALGDVFGIDLAPSSGRRRPVQRPAVKSAGQRPRRRSAAGSRASNTR